MSKLKDKVIVVVGSPGEFGTPLSQGLHDEGASLVLVSRTEENLLSQQQRLGKERTLVVPADASTAEGARKIFDTAMTKFGHIDAVVITAGTWARVYIDTPLEEAIAMSDHHYQSIFKPSFIVGHHAQQVFRKQGFGQIFNISSHAAFKFHLKGNLTYSPMKAASRSYMLNLANELDGTGILVSDIQPATINTPKARAAIGSEKEVKIYTVEPEDITRWIIDSFGDPDAPEEKYFPAIEDMP